MASLTTMKLIPLGLITYTGHFIARMVNITVQVPKSEDVYTAVSVELTS
jgi:hypothetical protein